MDYVRKPDGSVHKRETIQAIAYELVRLGLLDRYAPLHVRVRETRDAIQRLGLRELRAADSYINMVLRGPPWDGEEVLELGLLRDYVGFLRVRGVPPALIREALGEE